MYLILSLALSVLSGRGEEWRTFPFSDDALPIDLSAYLDAPAGQHGFLGVEGERFVFEDGTEGRFWGVTLTGSGCFPPQAMAPILAQRFARYGINLVRFEAMDAEWADPVLIETNRDGELRLNPVAIDRLDYFVHQLANRGIYSSFVGLSKREALPGALREMSAALEPGWPGAIHFMDELQIAHGDFLNAFWSHVNPYAQRQYRDSPFVILHELFDDNSISTFVSGDAGLLGRLTQRWVEWCEDHEHDAEPLSLRFPTAMQRRFLSYVQDFSQTNWLNQLRLMSVKVPIGGNGRSKTLWDLPPAVSMDFMHSEAQWGDAPTLVGPYLNEPHVAVAAQNPDSLFAALAFARFQEKPFVVTGWGSTWPHQARSEFPLWVAAMARMQGWNAVLSTTYLDTHREGDDEELFVGTIAHDPVIMGLMPTAALLMHRNEFRETLPRVTMHVPEEILDEGDLHTAETVRPTRLVDRASVRVAVGERPARAEVFYPTQPERILEAERFSQPASLIHDASRGVVEVRTPYTHAVMGSLVAHEASEDDAVQVVSEIGFGAVALTSLDDKPLAQSGEIWITLVSDARNRNFAWREQPDGYVIQRMGSAPIEIRDTPAWIFLNTAHEHWTIRGIDADGAMMHSVPYQWANGVLSVHLGTHGAIWYRAQRGSPPRNR